MTPDEIMSGFDLVGNIDLILVSRNPPEGLLVSMAYRHRHDFGLLDESQQKIILGEMRQLHEEVVGLGFYKYE